MMRHNPLYLPVTLLCLLAFTGCAEKGQTYNEEAAAYDPAMHTSAMNTNNTDTNPDNAEPGTPTKPEKPEKVQLTDDQWKAILSREEFYVLRRSGTEYPGTGRYLKLDASDKGYYHCVGCGNKLYNAKHKFHSGCGWPSFNQEVEPGAITEHRDTSAGMVRVEMRCARCDGHLGHIFDDAPKQPTGLRHCVNGVALIFVPDGEDPQAVIKKHREIYADR